MSREKGGILFVGSIQTYENFKARQNGDSQDILNHEMRKGELRVHSIVPEMIQMYFDSYGSVGLVAVIAEPDHILTIARLVTPPVKYVVSLSNDIPLSTQEKVRLVRVLKKRGIDLATPNIIRDKKLS